MAAFSGRRPANRALFPLCFLAGLLLMLAVIAGAVTYNAARTDLFESALERNVAVAGIISREDAASFAGETIGYLTGRADTWNPAVTADGNTLSLPDAFRAHMATVRQWMRFLLTVIPLCTVTGLLWLLVCMVIVRKGQEKRTLPVGVYLTGAALPLAAALGLGVWAALDFNGFWGWLHLTFIPDGIFPSWEPVMRLFPQTLFAGYIAPVGVALAIGVLIVVLLPFGVRRLIRKMKRNAVD